MEESVRGRKIPDKMGGKEADAWKNKNNLMAKLCLEWGGILSQHVLDLPEAHQHYCNEHDPERRGARDSTQRGEPEPSSAPCAGGSSSTEAPHAGERESSSTVLRAPTPV